MVALLTTATRLAGVVPKATTLAENAPGVGSVKWRMAAARRAAKVMATTGAINCSRYVRYGSRSCGVGSGHGRTKILRADQGRIELAYQPARRITMIRSEIPIQSSRSADTSNIATPARRTADNRVQIAAWAPTSTPRVGCAAMSTRGFPAISRPTMSFCWLPPESAEASTSMLGVRTSASATILSVSSRAALAVDPHPAVYRWMHLVAEDPVLPERCVQQETLAVTILGNLGESQAAPDAGGGIR